MYKYTYVNGCSLGSSREWSARSWNLSSLKLCSSRNIPPSFKEYLEGGLCGAHLHTSFKSQLSVQMLTTLMKEVHLILLYVLVFILFILLYLLLFCLGEQITCVPVFIPLIKCKCIMQYGWKMLRNAFFLWLQNGVLISDK